MLTAIERAELVGNALGVDSYELGLTETGVWDAMHLVMSIEDGRVIRLSAQCDIGRMRGPCALWSFDTANYTVPGLFARARQAAEVDWGWQDILSLDTSTGIPLVIFYDEELTADEEWQIVVTQLTLLEPPSAVSQS